MIRTGIVGGTGYTGVELLRLLSVHPEVSINVITSRAEAGNPVGQIFPNLRGHVDMEFSQPDADALAQCDVVFFATPNGTAMGHVPALLAAGCRVIDLAADFRLQDVAVWQKWYGVPHACPELLAEAVYGLPEMRRESIRTARIVANPGCYPTAVQLGFLPLLESNLVDLSSLIADAKSGVSGAGRKGDLGVSLCEVSESMKAYGVAGHRHLPEIRQGLIDACGQQVGLTFVPHLTPMVRGIHATLYARLTGKGKELSEADLQVLFEERYRHEPFVDVLPAGSHPATNTVRGANMCRMACHRPQSEDTVVVLSVIDNLGKGAAGQAVQNMNIMFGLAEETGLEMPAQLP